MLHTYQTKRIHATPHLHPHIQEHSHLSLNNATIIPQNISEHLEPVST